jgi:hypothetical protein
MMNDPIGKGGRADEPRFRVEDAKIVIRARSPFPADQFLLQANQIVFPGEFKPDRVGPVSFAAPASLVGQNEIGPGNHLWPKTSVGTCHGGSVIWEAGLGVSREKQKGALTHSGLPAPFCRRGFGTGTANRAGYQEIDLVVLLAQTGRVNGRPRHRHGIGQQKPTESV